MKIASATFFALSIPFKTSFAHGTFKRQASESVIVRLELEDGTIGYGEGAPRPYVTGEDTRSCLGYLQEYWQRCSCRALPEIFSAENPLSALAALDSFLPSIEAPQIIAPNAARAAFELALIDCILKAKQLCLSDILQPKRQEVVYSGVISSGEEETLRAYADYFKELGIRQVKVKLDGKEDKKRLLLLCSIFGPEVSLRGDANGVLEREHAAALIRELAELGLVCIEQPISRGDVKELALLKKEVGLPLMADESLVTIKDGAALIEAKAVDYFNLRLSKCGGIFNTLQLAKMARQAGLRLQVGAQVGETAILSAAARFVAAFLDDCDFVEGSFGRMLLTEDVAEQSLEFGQEGKAKLTGGPGLGLSIREEILKKYSSKIIECQA